MAAETKFNGLTLYTNGQSVKTIELGGWQPLVRFINGEIVISDFYGKLAIFNKSLDVLKTFQRSITTFNYNVRSLGGNNNYIAYGDSNGTVDYYSRTGGFEPKVSKFFLTLKTIYKGTYKHGQRVTSVDVQNVIVASGSIDYKIQVWNMKTSLKLFEVAHEGWVRCVKIVDEMLVSCGDQTIRIWNLKNGNLLHTLYFPSWCYNFDLNSEKTLLAVAHVKGVSIYNFSSRSKLMEIELDTASDVRFNESGTRLIVSQHDGKIFKIDLS